MEILILLLLSGGMELLEIEGCTPDFRYRIGFSRKLSGWMVHRVQVLHRGVPLLPGHAPQGLYETEKELLDHVVSWCNGIAHSLIADGSASASISSSPHTDLTLLSSN